MILQAFLAALAQFPDPRFRSVLWRGLGLTIGLLVGFYFALQWLIGLFFADPVTLPLLGEVTWMDEAIGWATLGLVLVMSVFLMVPVASAIAGLFLDEVADAVEDEYYPDLPVVPGVHFLDGLMDSLSFLGVLIGANIAAFFLYVIFPFAAPFIFYGMNGYLLGREYFQLAAMRREGREGARDMWRQHKSTIWLAGCLMAVPLSFPLVNLVIPILGAATFTHLYHRLSRG